MKILPFKIPKTTSESIYLQEDRESYFYDILHQHPEVQITYIIKGEGKLIIGDYIGQFYPGELFLIGPNLPHVFRSDVSKDDKGDEFQAHAYTIFFEWASLGDRFLNMPELKNLSEFVKICERGFKVDAESADKVKKIMDVTFASEGFQKIILFFQILQILSEKASLEPLTSFGTFSDFNDLDGKRLNDIYHFTMNEYSRKISLDEVAQIANMTTNSFCRYFKLRTRKSYVNFLNDIRIGQASKLLQQKDISISQVCFEVGFNNLSNFNRKFKEINKCSPSEFRAQLTNPASRNEKTR